MYWLYPWAFGIAGGVLVALAALSILYVDRAFQPAIRQCCRCLFSWVGQDKTCRRCGANSHTGEVDSRKPPEYDWQGHMDTQPIRMVR